MPLPMPTTPHLVMALPPLLANEGFGFDFDLLKTNLVNLAILVPILVWFLKDFLGGILQRRRETVVQDLQDAENRLGAAAAELQKAQADLAAAQQTAQRIFADGKARAEAVRAAGEQNTVAEMARLRSDAVASTEDEARKVSKALRRRTAEQAIATALDVLPEALTAERQQELLDNAIHSLG